MNNKTTYHERLQKQSLTKRIEAIRSDFLVYVDNETINYQKTQHYKNIPGYEDQYRVVQLSKKQKEDAKYQIRMLIRDAQECLQHLEDEK
jgi:hypothetical protein